MTIIVVNGTTYDTDDLTSQGGRGYEVATLAGTGETLPFYIAIMRDAVADATLQMVTTSVTSVTIGIGSKVFTLLAALPFQVGAFVQIASEASGANFMFGQVTDMTGSVLTLDVQVIGGSGTLTDWNVGAAGARGSTGAGITAIVEDTTPQLGGALDGQNENITDVNFPKFPVRGTVLLEVGEDVTKLIIKNVQQAFTLTEFIGISDSGTITASLQINGVETATLSITSTESIDNTFVDDSVAVDDDITIVFSSNSAAVNAFMHIVGEETLDIPT